MRTERAVALPGRPPRFSIRSLLYLTACLCLSFTFGSAGGGQTRADWVATGLVLATLGLSTELLRQAASVRGTPGYLGARLARYAAVLVMASCVLLSFAERAGWVSTYDNRRPIFSAWPLPFSEAVWRVALIAAISTLGVTARSPSRRFRWWGSVGPLLLVVYVAALVRELAFMPYFVHLATVGMEAAEPIAWRRNGAFPIHEREGFFTSRLATAAAFAVAATAGSVVLAVRGAHPVGRRLAAVACVCLIAALGGWAWWWFRVEFPRVSPDMAAASPGATPVRLVGGVALLLTLAGWVACRLSRDTADPSVTSDRPRNALAIWLAAIGLAIGGIVPAGRNAIDLLSEFLSWFNVSTLQVLGEAFRYLLLSPSLLLDLALAIASLSLLRVAWTARQTEVHRLPIRRVAAAGAMLTALGAVATPVLAAYGFGAWLVPWWR